MPPHWTASTGCLFSPPSLSLSTSSDCIPQHLPRAIARPQKGYSCYKLSNEVKECLLLKDIHDGLLWCSMTCNMMM